MHHAALFWLVIATLLFGPELTRAAETPDTNAPPPRLYGDRVEPHWLDGNTKFWYRVQTGKNTYEYVLVDAQAGARKSAFDHAKLAAALNSAGVKDAAPDRLALDNLRFSSEGSVTFMAGGKAWSWTSTKGELTASETTADKTAAGVAGTTRSASERTGEETSFTLVNRTAGEIRLFWLDSEGERRSYGTVAPDESRSQHTYAGHVWCVMDEHGTELRRWEAGEEPATIEVNGAKDASQPAAPSRRRRRPQSSLESPDGRWRAAFENANLVVTAADSGKRVIVTTDGTLEDGYSEPVYWSPDSTRAVVMRTQKGEDHKVYAVESSPKDQVQPKLHSWEYLKPGDRVPISKPHLFDLIGGCEKPLNDKLYPNPWSITDLRWSPDSMRFTFVYNQRGHQVLRIIAVDAMTSAAQAIVEEQSATFIDYSGKFYAEYVDAPQDAIHTNSSLSEIVWMSERGGWNHLYLYDARTGIVKNQITRGPWVVRAVDKVDSEKRQIWFRAGGIYPEQDPYYVHYCRVNFDGSGLRILTKGDGTHRIRYSPDQRWFIDTWSRADLPPINELRRSETGELSCPLEQADDAEPRAANIRYPQAFVAKGRDGETDIYGLIRFPDHFELGKKYPVIESIYAGPQGAFVPKSFQLPPSRRSLTADGFFVVQIDGMGTSERSKKFHDVCWKNLGDSGFPDRILWMKAAAARYPAMDLTRVGIYGTSAGGQSALRALLAHGDFYKAAVSDSGCHDNRMDKIWWNEQWMGWPIGPHYEEQSNVTQAHQLQGKLLLMFGELDRNVDPASTMQVVNALIKADKDFELLIVPGAGHGVLGMPYAQRRMVSFFKDAFCASF